MRSGLITLVLGLFMLALSAYLAVYVVNPLDEPAIRTLISAKQLETPELIYAELGSLLTQGVILDFLSVRKLILVGGVAVAGVVMLFMTIHLAMDKFFFKEFYKPANFKLALRRGVELAVILTAGIYLRLLGADWLSAFSLVPVVLVLELVIWQVSRKRKGVEREKGMGNGAGERQEGVGMGLD